MEQLSGAGTNDSEEWTHEPRIERKISSPTSEAICGEKAPSINGASANSDVFISDIAACNANQPLDRRQKDTCLSTLMSTWIENML